MKWRFIPFMRYDPYVKTALNEVALDSVRTTGEGIVWLAGWSKSCINVGFGQAVKDVVNLEEAKKLGLSIVRRQGGGGAMYLDSEHEISWAIVAPENNFANNPNDVYKEVCDVVVHALSKLGIGAHHKPINDIVTNNGKISGATLKKDRDVVYVGGTLLYDVDKTVLERVLRPERDSEKRKSVPEHEKQLTAVCNECDASFDDVIVSLREQLLEGKDYGVTEWDAEELEEAEKLAERYKSNEWVYQR